MPRIFVRKILRLIYGPVNDNGIWRIRCISELCTIYSEPYIVKVVKIGRLRCLKHLFRMQELDRCRKYTLLKPEGTRRVGKPELRWLESVEEDLKTMGVRNWRRKSRDRDEWRTILEEAKVHRELKCQEKNNEGEDEEKRKKKNFLTNFRKNPKYKI